MEQDESAPSMVRTRSTLNIEGRIEPCRLQIHLMCINLTLLSTGNERVNFAQAGFGQFQGCGV